MCVRVRARSLSLSLTHTHNTYIQITTYVSQFASLSLNMH